MSFGHSTPVIITVKKKPQMLVLAGGMSESDKALRSLDPSNGKLLWWCRGNAETASAAFGSGIVYFDNGRGKGGVAVDPGGTGEVSETKILWTIPRISSTVSSPIIVGNLLYRLVAGNTLMCFEVATGKVVYTEKLKGLTSTWASPVVDGNGNLYFASSGKSYVIRSGPEFHVLSVNDLGDANHSSPAIAKGRLFLVGQKNIYCIGQGK